MSGVKSLARSLKCW